MPTSSTETAPVVSAHGLEMPAVGFGTFQIPDDEAADAVAHALSVGYRHVDTAEMYRNERGVGAGIRASGLDRDDVWVTTKVPHGKAAPGDVAPCVQDCLDRLEMDHVDLVLLHWPSHDIEVEATVEALDVVRERGLTRAIGISNHPTDLMRRAAETAPVFTNQVEFHPMLGQDAVLAAAAETGMTVTAYSPVARGRVFSNDTLVDVAASHDARAGQVALRWLLDHGNVAVLPRSSNPDHIAENFRVDVDLTDQDRARIEALPKDMRLINPPFAPDWD